MTDHGKTRKLLGEIEKIIQLTLDEGRIENLRVESGEWVVDRIYEPYPEELEMRDLFRVSI